MLLEKSKQLENLVLYYRIYPTISINSTSNIKVLFGPISLLSFCLPYAKCGGITNSYLPPSDINCKPSVKPLITLFNGKVSGQPLSIELYNISRFIIDP